MRYKIPSDTDIPKTNIPNMTKTDIRLMHWTMHHGSAFFSKSEVNSLSSRIDQHFEKLNKKLSELESKIK